MPHSDEVDPKVKKGIVLERAPLLRAFLDVRALQADSSRGKWRGGIEEFVLPLRKQAKIVYGDVGWLAGLTRQADQMAKSGIYVGGLDEFCKRRTVEDLLLMGGEIGNSMDIRLFSRDVVAQLRRAELLNDWDFEDFDPGGSKERVILEKMDEGITLREKILTASFTNQTQTTVSQTPLSREVRDLLDRLL